MDLKQLITRFSFRIEPKPGGGFIARPIDPSVPALEAATREELREKIQAQIAAALAEQFPALKAQPGSKVNFALHIEHKPEGGFDIHSSDPNSAPAFAASHDEVESHFAEKFVAAVGKQILPQLAPELAQQLAAGNLKVFINKGTGITVTSTSTSSVLSQERPASAPAELTPGSPFKAEMFSSSSASNAVNDSPIQPEANNSWTFLRLLFAALVVALLAYLYLHFR